MKLKYLSINQI